jgi:hypothetical protein
MSDVPSPAEPPMPAVSRTALEHGSSSAEWKAVHEELKANDTSWHCLAFEGIQHDGHGGLIEYRRCPGCQSTLGRPIAADDALGLCQHQAALYGRSTEAVRSAMRIADGSGEGDLKRS